MKKVYSLFMLLIATIMGQAQRVERTDYNLLLKGLLSHSVPEIGVSEIDSAQNWVYLDARAKKEFEVSHIDSAAWVGYDEFDPCQVAHLSHDTPIIVYCSVGYRSEKVAEQLKAKGYTQVYNLYGGIFEWKNAGFEVYNSAGQPTEKVHAYDKVWGLWLRSGEKCYD
ncbi:rhodanese-like domain-containing protein [bacterium SCSIO 12741]|nr:rhodanese-like domain-containing protein [bacterium SCSIO 12741]